MLTNDDPQPADTKLAKDDAPVRNARRRRKDARPGEIVEAAIEVFAEHGFGAAKIEEVAKRASVSKGTVFVYFDSKEELFRAAARSLLSTNLEKLSQLSGAADTPMTEFVPKLLSQAARIGDTRAPAMVRLLMSESRRFPDIAQIWYDEVASKVLGLLTAAITRAQARGEIRDGDPTFFAISIIGPMLAGTLFREILSMTSAPLPDLQALAEQHARTILPGILLPLD